MARSTSTTKLKPWQIVVILVIAGLVYAYQAGYFDRWFGRTSLEPTSVAGPTTPTNPPTMADPNNVIAALDPAKAYVAEGAWYQVFFTRPSYPEKAAGRKGGVDAAMIADIDAAKSTIYIASFDFDLELMTDALIRAKKRKVKVQLVVDDENLASPEVAETTGRLEAAKIPITWDERSAFMHNKIVVIDDTIVWTGSMNLVVNDVYRNNNNMIRSTLPELVSNYRQRFLDLYAGKLGSKAPKNTPNPVIKLAGGVQIETYFSPVDKPRSKIVNYIKKAKQSVNVLAFSFTDDDTAQALIDRHEAGLEVQVVMEARNADGTGSEFGILEDAGIPILRDANCYILHNKTMIIDEKIVITGSYNFTAAAENNNDENLLIITDPDLARHYLAEFDRLYAQAKNPAGCGR